MSDYWQPTGMDWNQTMTPAVDYSNIPSVNLEGVNALSTATQPPRSSFDWISGIKAIGGLAQDIGKGIYLAKGYQPSPFMGSNGFGTEAERGKDGFSLEEVKELLYEIAKEKRDQNFEITPLRGSQSVV